MCSGLSSIFGGPQTVNTGQNQSTLQNINQASNQQMQSATTQSQLQAANPFAQGVGANVSALSNIIQQGSPYPWLETAPLTQGQMLGIENLTTAGQTTKPLIGQGAGYFGQAGDIINQAPSYIGQGAGFINTSGQPITGQDVAGFYNPFAENVTANLQDIFGQQNLANRIGATAQSGGVGASRAAVGQALLAQKQGLTAGGVYADLYQRALQAAQQQKAQQLGAGQALVGAGGAQAGVGSALGNLGLQGIQAGYGGLQAGLQGEQIYRDWLNQSNAAWMQHNLGVYQDPFMRMAAQAQTLPGLIGLGGTGFQTSATNAAQQGALSGTQQGTGVGTGTTTYPAPPILPQIAGLGLAGAGLLGLFSDPRAKTDVQRVGRDRSSGLPMYAFRYKGDPKSYPKVIGPMADDVEKKYPNAVRHLDFVKNKKGEYQDGGEVSSDDMTDVGGGDYDTGDTSISVQDDDSDQQPSMLERTQGQLQRQNQSAYQKQQQQRAQRFKDYQKYAAQVQKVQKALTPNQTLTQRVSQPITMPATPWAIGQMPQWRQTGGAVAPNFGNRLPNSAAAWTQSAIPRAAWPTAPANPAPYMQPMNYGNLFAAARSPFMSLGRRFQQGGRADEQTEAEFYHDRNAARMTAQSLPYFVHKREVLSPRGNTFDPMPTNPFGRRRDVIYQEGGAVTPADATPPPADATPPPDPMSTFNQQMYGGMGYGGLPGWGGTPLPVASAAPAATDITAATFQPISGGGFQNPYTSAPGVGGMAPASVTFNSALASPIVQRALQGPNAPLLSYYLQQLNEPNIQHNPTAAVANVRGLVGLRRHGGRVYQEGGAVDDDEHEPAGLPWLDDDSDHEEAAGLPLTSDVPLPRARPSGDIGGEETGAPTFGGGRGYGGTRLGLGAGTAGTTSPYMALMHAGLGMLAASGQRDARGLPMSPLGAIGAGGMAGVQAYERGQQQNAAMDLKRQSLLRQNLALADLMRHRRAIEGRAGTAKRYKMTDPNTLEQYLVDEEGNRIGGGKPAQPAASTEQQAQVTETQKGVPALGAASFEPGGDRATADIPEPAPAGGLQPGGIKFAAEQLFQTGSMPPGMSRNRLAVAAITNYAEQLATSRGLTLNQAIEMQRFNKRQAGWIMGVDGRQAGSMGTLIDHLQTLDDLTKALKNGDNQTYNLIKNKVAKWTGSEYPTNVQMGAQIVGSEILKAIGITGGATGEERVDAGLHIGDLAKSPAQFSGAINVAKRLAAGQLNTKLRQARSIGLKEERIEALVGADAYKQLKAMGQQPTEAKPFEGQKTGSPQEGDKKQFKEGPATFKGGKWVLD